MVPHKTLFLSWSGHCSFGIHSSRCFYPHSVEPSLGSVHFGVRYRWRGAAIYKVGLQGPSCESAVAETRDEQRIL